MKKGNKIVEVFIGMCFMNFFMGLGNVRNDIKGFIFWYLFLVGFVRNVIGKSRF